MTDSPFWGRLPNYFPQPNVVLNCTSLVALQPNNGPQRAVKYFFGCRTIPSCLKLKAYSRVFVDSSDWLSAYCS